MKALIKVGDAYLDGACNYLSRHPVPRPFCVLRFVGVRATIINAFDPAASGLRVLHHPTLGAAPPALFLGVGGEPLGSFAGDPAPYPWTDSPGYIAPDLADEGIVDVWALGQCSASAPVTATDDARAIGLKLTTAVLLNSIRPAAIIFRSDTGTWANVASKWKNLDGSPRVDPDDLPDAYATVVAPPPLVP